MLLCGNNEDGVKLQWDLAHEREAAECNNIISISATVLYKLAFMLFDIAFIILKAQTSVHTLCYHTL